jgi:hypothetical protein
MRTFASVKGALRQDCTTATIVVAVLIVSTRKAFAAGYALAKAVFEFERARWGVKGRAPRVDEVDKPLDSTSCAGRIVERGKRSDALNRSKCFGLGSSLTISGIA